MTTPPCSHAISADADSPRRYVADTDPRFVALHRDVRALLREGEEGIASDLRTSLDAAYSQIPIFILDAMKPALETFAAAIPANFIRSLYEIFKLLSDDVTVAEQVVSARLAGAVSPSKKTH
jgi:hypothetical protein